MGVAVMTQYQALFAKLLPVAVLALVYVIHLYRTAQPETDEEDQVTRLREELAAVKEERDTLKRTLRSLGQE
jgi:hypothetical protein